MDFCVANDKNVKDYEFVDLGLPSGLKWAKCNLGAKTETDYGYYYMWGSTTPNDDECSWENAPFNNGSGEFGEEYFNTHKSEFLNGDTLKTEYDAAVVAGVGRTPTKADFEELLMGTTNDWVEDYKSSGVSGRLFTSKTNGNSIFIPSSGYCYVSDFNRQGNDGYVWSSSLSVSNPSEAWFLGFYSGSCNMDDYYRCSGNSVRPVRN